MKAMILAAGVGSRLEPLTCNIPKPMVPVANRPAMEHIIRLLAKNGIDRDRRQPVVPAAQDRGAISATAGDGASSFVYSKERESAGHRRRRTPHDGRFLRPDFCGYLRRCPDRYRPGPTVAHAQGTGALATIALKPVPDPHQFGVVIIEDDGRIRAFPGKTRPGRGLEQSGQHGHLRFRTGDLRPHPARARSSTSANRSSRALVEQGLPFYGHVINDYWCDIGSLTQYRLAQYDVLRGRVKISIPGMWNPGAVYVGEGTYIAPTAAIGTKVIIGANCHISDGVEIFGETVIGDNCVIESGAAIFGSIIWNNTRIARGARLVECVVGSECYLKEGSVIGAGVILSDDCVVEQNEVIEANVKVWPGNVVGVTSDGPTSKSGRGGT